MCIQDFNQLSLDDKILLVNKSDSKLIESHPWYGKYKTNIYELDGMKVHVLVNDGNKRIALVNALEDAELYTFSDTTHMN